MEKRVLKKQNLDKISASLLKATQITDAEIEKIVSKPQLFDSVVARIKTEEINYRQKPFYGKRLLLNSATAIVAVLVIAAIVFYNRSNDSNENLLAQNESSVKPQIPTISGENLPAPLPSIENKSIVKTTAQPTKTPGQKLDSNRQSKSPKSPIRKSLPVPDSLPAEQIYADEGKFYALPFADNSTDNDTTQIVRAELSRAELSALGVDLSHIDENEDGRILTDLIYGANGNPKAFRLIGKL